MFLTKIYAIYFSFTGDRFRSYVLMVMSHTPFHCATPVSIYSEKKNLENKRTKYLIKKIDGKNEQKFLEINLKNVV